MSNRLCLTALILVALLDQAASLADQPSTNPAGSWKWESDYGAGPVEQWLILQSEGKNVTGFYRNGDGDHEIKKGVFKDDEFTFQLVIDRKGKPIEIVCNGKIDDDEMTATSDITYKGENNSIGFTATRSTRIADVVGDWKLRVEAEGNVYTPTLKITKKGDKLAATYDAEQVGTFNVENIELKDNVVKFDFTMRFNDNELELKYEVVPRGNKMTGNVEYEVRDISGDADVVGERLPKQK